MSATTYDGPDRRLAPREETLPPDAPITDRLIMKLDVIRRLIISGLLDRRKHDGPGA
jgi:hypothetical protein